MLVAYFCVIRINKRHTIKKEKEIDMKDSQAVYLITKRALDIIIAYFMLIFSYPLMILIALGIKLCDGGPVIFRQVRIGKNEIPFVCYKFRTMRTDAPNDLSTSEFYNARDYITPIGSFLRRTSLDELPQLFNVLAGEMSIIGPRPLIPKEKNIHVIRRHGGAYSLRPGITGLAQVCGRDDLSDTSKAMCDIIYAKGISIGSDIAILTATFFNVIRGEGIANNKH